MSSLLSGIQSYIQQHNIDPRYTNDLMRYAENTETYQVFDDSGSMLNGMGPTYRGKSRFEVLSEAAETEWKISNMLDRNGIGVCFLDRELPGAVGKAGLVTLGNRPEDLETLKSFFRKDPAGGTPTVRKLNELVEDLTPVLKERKVQIRFHTDGIPDGGMEALDGWFRNSYITNALLVDKLAITFILYVDGHDKDGQELIKHYERVIDPMVGLKGERLSIDVVLPYPLAKQEAEANNPGFHYGENEHFIKSFLGASNRVVDELGEKGGTKVDAKTNMILTEEVVAQMPGQGCCVVM